MDKLLDEREFVEADGLVHLARGEFTICGDAFDLGSEEADYEWKATNRRVVTCPMCASIVEICRGVRARATQGSQRDG